MQTLVRPTDRDKSRRLLHVLCTAIGQPERPPEVIAAAQTAGHLWAWLDDQYPHDIRAMDEVEELAIALAGLGVIIR